MNRKQQAGWAFILLAPLIFPCRAGAAAAVENPRVVFTNADHFDANIFRRDGRLDTQMLWERLFFSSSFLEIADGPGGIWGRLTTNIEFGLTWITLNALQPVIRARGVLFVKVDPSNGFAFWYYKNRSLGITDATTESLASVWVQNIAPEEVDPFIRSFRPSAAVFVKRVEEIAKLRSGAP